MASRASGSRFYDPENPSNRVTFKARCDFLKLVLDNEPELAKRLSEDVFPLFFGVHPEEHIETMQMTFLSLYIHEALAHKSADLPYEAAEKTIYLKGRREIWKGDLVQLREINVLDTVNKLVDFYEEMQLWRLGRWTLEIFIRFAIYWNEQPAIGTFNMEILFQEFLKGNTTLTPDGALSITFPHPAVTFRYAPLELKDHAVILELLPPRSPMSILEEANAEKQPQYKFQSLPWNNYVMRHGAMLSDEKRKRPANAVPIPLPWFFDPATEEYFTPVYSIEDYSPTELGDVLKEAQAESRTHYLKRLEVWAKEKGLESFQGHRKTSTEPEERYHYLYLYSVKQLSIEEITDYVTSEWKKQGKDKIPDSGYIEESIEATAQHLKMHIEDFAKRDERIKKQKEFELLLDELYPLGE